MNGPVTLDRLIEQGKLVWVYCNDCGHERDVDPSTLPLSHDLAVPEAGKRMMCSRCGGNKIETKPELYPGGIEAVRSKHRRS